MPPPQLAGSGPGSLKARVLGQPKREDLVQIQLNEQLIVELYSEVSGLR